MPLRITAGGQSWLSEDYTLDEMVEVESLTKTRWSYVVASADTEAESVRALVTVWFGRTGTAEEAAKRAGALTNRQVNVEQVEDDRPVEYDEGIPVVDPKADGVVPATT